MALSADIGHAGAPVLVFGADMDISTLAAFAAAFFVFAASPGPDNMTIVARTISHGPGSGLAYGAGTVAGILLFLSLAGFGLSLVAGEMGGLMTVLRYAGAAFLVWMGVRLWTAPPIVPDTTALPERRGLATVFLTGFALNLGNPKMPLFYVALLPNVVGTKSDAATLAELAAIIIAVEIAVIGGHVLLALRARRLLRSKAVVQRVNRAAGGVMIGAAVAVVATR
jgi:threonine/homoserine/homoserine lactone efflux protein